MGPRPAAMLVDGDGELVFPPPEAGPWELEVLVEGNAADSIYDAPLRATLRFDARWPGAAPVIRVEGLLSYAMIDRSRAPPTSFYLQLARDADGHFSLTDILHKLRHFLLDPVEALGLAEEGAEDSEAKRARNWVRDVRKLNEKRVDVIKKYALVAKSRVLFQPLEPLRAEWFDSHVWSASQAGTAEAWRGVLTEHIPGQVYSMPLFTEDFCDLLLEELFSFYATGLPAKRPNSMNSYGIILGDIGLEPFVDKLQAFLQPLGRHLFPGPGTAWDGHHCFIVRYREGEDLGLDMHTDDSDVTFNICLGLDFTGAGLQFCGSLGAADHRHHSITYQHRKGYCVVHPGRRRHGADDIQSGERLNLILWNQSSVYRKSMEYRQPDYVQEAGPPAPVCLSYTHDRDYGVFKKYPPGKEMFATRGWCPPEDAEYAGFKPERVGADGAESPRPRL